MTEFFDKTEIPDVLSDTQRGFSVDVLVYSPATDEHTVGWYNYNTDEWCFLCREAVKKFKWRYFNDKTDKWIKKRYSKRTSKTE